MVLVHSISTTLWHRIRAGAISSNPLLVTRCSIIGRCTVMPLSFVLVVDEIVPDWQD